MNVDIDIYLKNEAVLWKTVSWCWSKERQWEGEKLAHHAPSSFNLQYVEPSRCQDWHQSFTSIAVLRSPLWSLRPSLWPVALYRYLKISNSCWSFPSFHILPGAGGIMPCIPPDIPVFGPKRIYIRLESRKVHHILVCHVHHFCVHSFHGSLLSLTLQKCIHLSLLL